jgi:hypothetical protein
MVNQSKNRLCHFSDLGTKLIFGCVVVRNYLFIFGLVSFFQLKEIFGQQMVLVTLLVSMY